MGEVILSAKQIKAEALRLGFSACGVANRTAPEKRTRDRRNRIWNNRLKKA